MERGERREERRQWASSHACHAMLHAITSCI
jgi:hypothetical protein